MYQNDNEYITYKKMFNSYSNNISNKTHFPQTNCLRHSQFRPKKVICLFQVTRPYIEKNSDPIIMFSDFFQFNEEKTCFNDKNIRKQMKIKPNPIYLILFKWLRKTDLLLQGLIDIFLYLSNKGTRLLLRAELYESE